MRAADACPGVLRPHRAEDGAMVRLRFPGGRIDATVLRRLGELASVYGNGLVQLTSRAGLQLRGLPDTLPADFVTEVTAAGVLPTASHERVRNIVASPLTGLAVPAGIPAGRADLRSMTAELDRAVRAQPALAELPGRFLFVLDDGRGDVIDLRFDLGYQAISPERGVMLAGGPDRGLPVRAGDAVSTIIDLALAFAGARKASGAWHVTELPAWLESLGLLPAGTHHGAHATPLGRVGGAASVIAPLARLTLDQTRVVEDAADTRQVIITPWRGLVLPGAAARLDELTAAGLVADDDSAWTRLTACVGAPYCGKARADTSAAAHELVALATPGDPLPRTHLAGCERRCGAPAAEHVDLVAPTAADLHRTADLSTTTGIRV